MSAPTGVVVLGIVLGFWPFVVKDCGDDAPPVAASGPVGATSVSSSTSSSSATTGAGGEGGQGGAGGASTTATTGGGGQGGAPECAQALACGVDGECDSWVCHVGKCLHAFEPAGSDAGEEGPVGDCEILVCDGQGGTMPAVKLTDVPDDGNDCTDDTCDPGVTFTPRAKGTSCVTNGGQLCDAGACVEFIPVKCKSNSTGQIYVGCEGKIHIDYNTITVDVVDGFSCGSHDLPAVGYCAPGTPCSIWHVGKPADGGECQ